jgi:acyl carrier protein
MSNISERVKKVIVEHLGIDPDKVTEDANFIDDLRSPPTPDRRFR